jgi:hypothetical protein
VPREKADLVIFTGAGASKPLGYPVTKEFFAGESEVPIYKWLKGMYNTEELDVEIALDTLNEVKEFSESDGGRFLSFLTSPYPQPFPSIAEYIEHIVTIQVV